MTEEFDNGAWNLKSNQLYNLLDKMKEYVGWKKIMNEKRQIRVRNQ